MFGRGICKKYQSRDEKWLNKQYLLFVVFRNILFLLFVTWQLLNTIGRFEWFPSAGTVVVLDSG
jgi:hypothetical protein